MSPSPNYYQWYWSHIQSGLPTYPHPIETGNDASGLQHIIKEHGSQFNGKGISNENIPNYVLEAVYQGNIVGTQGKKSPPRTVYEFTYNGKKQRIAVQVSNNGYIVGANPKSLKE